MVNKGRFLLSPLSLLEKVSPQPSDSDVEPAVPKPGAPQQPETFLPRDLDRKGRTTLLSTPLRLPCFTVFVAHTWTWRFESRNLFLKFFIKVICSQFFYFKSISYKSMFNNQTIFLQSASPFSLPSLSPVQFCFPKATKRLLTPDAASGICLSVSE